ncbi:MAG: hypothetical protein GXO27_05120 [Chlorobi bacterium]|nr:hypothetical protein [Chlorobiota bacterium]
MAFILPAFLLMLPPVRSRLAKVVLDRVNAAYGTDITAREIRFIPPSRIEADDLLVRDHHGDTLFYAAGVRTRVSRWWSFFRNRYLFGPLDIRDGRIKIIVYPGETEDNFSVFLSKFDRSSGEGQHKPFFLRFKAIRWNGGRISVYNLNHRPDPAYDMKRFGAEVRPFVIDGKTLTAGIRRMAFHDSFGLNVTELAADFFYSPDSMLFDRLRYATDRSQFDGRLGFYYTKEDLKEFYDRVELRGHLEGYAGTEDANKLAGDLFAPGYRFHLTSDLEGVLNELEFADARIRVPGTGLSYRGDLLVFELTEPSQMGVSARIERMEGDYNDLVRLMPEITREKIPAVWKRTGRNRLSGEFEYLPGKVYGKLDVRNAVGRLMPHFNIRLDSVQPFWVRFRTPGMDLGRLTGDFAWGKLSFEGEASGEGLDLSRTRTTFTLRADRVEYRGYPYTRLQAGGKIIDGVFSGMFAAADPAFQARLEGRARLKGRRSWKFRASVPRWDLYRTGWVTSDTLAVLRFEGSTDMQGNTLNDLTGTLRLDRLTYRRSGKEYALNYFYLLSTEREGEKYIEINSDKAVNGYLKGRFRIDRLGDMYREMLGTVFTGLKPSREFADQYVRFKFMFDSDLLEILDPRVEYTRKTELKGRISGKDRYVHTDLKSEELRYAGIDFYRTRLSIDNRNPIYNLYLAADSVRFPGYTFQMVRAINVTMQDTVYLKLKSNGGPGMRDMYDISAKYTLDSLRNMDFRFGRSEMHIKHKTWLIDPSRHADRIRYFSANDSLAVEDFVLFHADESFRAHGYHTPRRRAMDFDLRNLHLSDWLPAMEGFRFEGIVNGHVFAGKNNDIPFYNAEVGIDSLSWNDTPLGRLGGTLKTISTRTIFLDIRGDRGDEPLLRANGYVDTRTRDLDVNLTLNNFPLRPFNELLRDVFSGIRGTVTGHTAITGKFKNPQYHGVLNLFGAGLTVNELNTDYQMHDREQVRIEGNKFVFDRNRFFDTKYRTEGTLDGYISFYNFTNWYLDLAVNTGHLLVLDTPPRDDALYYGTAFVEGNASIKGYTTKIKIDAAVRSRPDTKIFIPLRDVETIGDDPFIRFYTEEEYVRKQQDTLLTARIYEGLELNLDIDITEDAEVEIVLDREFGSTLKSRGVGNVLMEINTEGKFNMWGRYEVREGKYNFRYAGVIDKEFEVEPGSTIIWNGDPFRAELDIRAVYYIPAADITPLLSQSVPVSKRVPVKVIIYIKGDLMKPRIDFEVELPEASPIIRSEVEYALRDPDMRMLQVISLLYSGNFISPDILKFDNRTAVEGNLSERVLSVFNSLLENDIFNVKLDYVPDRQDPYTNVKTDSRVGLTIQTKINKRIYINGKLAMPVGRYTKSSVSGDVEAEIWLNENGTIRLRIYNKRTEIEFVDQEESYTRGLGISFQVDFDTFKELLEKMHIRIEARD